MASLLHLTGQSPQKGKVVTLPRTSNPTPGDVGKITQEAQKQIEIASCQITQAQVQIAGNREQLEARLEESTRLHADVQAGINKTQAAIKKQALITKAAYTVAAGFSIALTALAAVEWLSRPR